MKMIFYDFIYFHSLYVILILSNLKIYKTYSVINNMGIIVTVLLCGVNEIWIKKLLIRMRRDFDAF